MLFFMHNLTTTDPQKLMLGLNESYPTPKYYPGNGSAGSFQGGTSELCSIFCIMLLTL